MKLEGMPELPPGMEMLSDLQSGTMKVVHLDLVREYGLRCYQAGVEAERERCAKLCDEINSESGGGFEPFAAAIRKPD